MMVRVSVSMIVRNEERRLAVPELGAVAGWSRVPLVAAMFAASCGADPVGLDDVDPTDIKAAEVEVGALIDGADVDAVVSSVAAVPDKPKPIVRGQRTVVPWQYGVDGHSCVDISNNGFVSLFGLSLGTLPDGYDPATVYETPMHLKDAPRHVVSVFQPGGEVAWSRQVRMYELLNATCTVSSDGAVMIGAEYTGPVDLMDGHLVESEVRPANYLVAMGPSGSTLMVRTLGPNIPHWPTKSQVIAVRSGWLVLANLISVDFGGGELQSVPPGSPAYWWGMKDLFGALYARDGSLTWSARLGGPLSVGRVVPDGEHTVAISGVFDRSTMSDGTLFSGAPDVSGPGETFVGHIGAAADVFGLTTFVRPATFAPDWVEGMHTVPFVSTPDGDWVFATTDSLLDRRDAEMNEVWSLASHSCDVAPEETDNCGWEAWLVAVAPSGDIYAVGPGSATTVCGGVRFEHPSDRSLVVGRVDPGGTVLECRVLSWNRGYCRPQRLRMTEDGHLVLATECVPPPSVSFWDVFSGPTICEGPEPCETATLTGPCGDTTFDNPVLIIDRWPIADGLPPNIDCEGAGG